MASRSLEHKRDQLKVILVTPFMSCNARLTIYILFSEMFFGNRAMLVAYSMYMIGLLVAILVSLVIHWTDKARHKDKDDYLLIELPEYKMPDLRTVCIYVEDKVKSYLEKAGTTIFLATLLIWFVLNFEPQRLYHRRGPKLRRRLSHWLVPVFRPIGLGFWQITLALLAGISAKEVWFPAVPCFLALPIRAPGKGWEPLLRPWGASALPPSTPCA